MIRGDQISSQIGARLNPTHDYHDDVCVYVKPGIRRFDHFKFENNSYLDILDGFTLIRLLKNYEHVPVVACSQKDYDYLSDCLKNKIILIPQHHCNFERATRGNSQITTIGMVGGEYAFAHLSPDFEEQLFKRGICFIKLSKFFSRQDIVDFYKSIDVQIVWRPYQKILANPLKLVNAASFGVPTIAYQEEFFKEMDGYYIPVNTFDDFFIQLDLLRSSPSLYEDYSKRCICKTERYHIENIGAEYKKWLI
jgi:hypothetical protein